MCPAREDAKSFTQRLYDRPIVIVIIRTVPARLKPLDFAGPFRIDMDPSTGCGGDDASETLSSLAVADRAVGVAGRPRRAGADVFVTSCDRGNAGSITPGTAVAAWRSLGSICPSRASNSTTDPGPSRRGACRWWDGSSDTRGPADQPRGRDATLRGPAARYRRGHGTGSTGSRFAVAGQGPLDPQSQRGRRLLPARWCPARHLHRSEFSERDADVLRRRRPQLVRRAHGCDLRPACGAARGRLAAGGPPGRAERCPAHGGPSLFRRPGGAGKTARRRGDDREGRAARELHQGAGTEPDRTAGD